MVCIFFSPKDIEHERWKSMILERSPSNQRKLKKNDRIRRTRQELLILDGEELLDTQEANQHRRQGANLHWRQEYPSNPYSSASYLLPKIHINLAVRHKPKN